MLDCCTLKFHIETDRRCVARLKTLIVLQGGGQGGHAGHDCCLCLSISHIPRPCNTTDPPLLYRKLSLAAYLWWSNYWYCWMQWAELQYCSSECWCECWHPWRWCWPRRLLPPYTGHCSVDRAAAAARVKVGDIPQWQLWTLNTHNRGDRYQVRPVGGQTYRDSPLCWSEWHDEGVMQSDSSIQSTISTLTVVGSTWWSLLSSLIKLLRSDLTYLFI